MIPECEVSQQIVQSLSRHFSVFPEVYSKCGKFRIDFIVVCNISSAAFGLEIKRIDKKRGNEIGDLILQAQNYSKCEFKVNGIFQRVPIFIAPPLSYDILMCPDEKITHLGVDYFKDRHPHDFSHHTANGFLGALKIGELRTNTKEKYFYFSFSNQTIWSSCKKSEYPDIFEPNNIIGLHSVNYNLLLKRLEI